MFPHSNLLTHFRIGRSFFQVVQHSSMLFNIFYSIQNKISTHANLTICMSRFINTAKPHFVELRRNVNAQTYSRKEKSGNLMFYRTFRASKACNRYPTLQRLPKSRLISSFFMKILKKETIVPSKTNETSRRLSVSLHMSFKLLIVGHRFYCFYKKII